MFLWWLFPRLSRFSVIQHCSSQQRFLAWVWSKRCSSGRGTLLSVVSALIEALLCFHSTGKFHWVVDFVLWSCGLCSVHLGWKSFKLMSDTYVNYQCVNVQFLVGEVSKLRDAKMSNRYPLTCKACMWTLNACWFYPKIICKDGLCRQNISGPLLDSTGQWKGTW